MRNTPSSFIAGQHSRSQRSVSTRSTSAPFCVVLQLRSLYPEHTITETGQWWYDEHEIDVVDLTTSETLIVGECKFTQAPLGYDAFATLQDHVEKIRWTPEDGGDRVETYALFSRCGFTSAIEEATEERDDLELFSAGDVVDALT